MQLPRIWAQVQEFGSPLPFWLRSPTESKTKMACYGQPDGVKTYNHH